MLYKLLAGRGSTACISTVLSAFGGMGVDILTDGTSCRVPALLCWGIKLTVQRDELCIKTIVSPQIKIFCYAVWFSLANCPSQSSHGGYSVGGRLGVRKKLGASKKRVLSSLIAILEMWNLLRYRTTMRMSTMKKRGIPLSE